MIIDDIKNTVICGDNKDVLKEFPDNSIDSIVTDPQYGISFMGMKWDYDLPTVEQFKEMLRVLKPGGHILCACGTRTQHRMACNIEDAGFEIRDVISWIYGSGFPKSLNIGKAIDKKLGADREKIPVGDPVKRMIPGADKDKTGSWIKDNGREYQPSIEIPATEQAKQFEGWGTALKPAQEFFTLARKPLSEKNVADNVLKWGTGGINIDGCRIEASENDRQDYGRDNDISYMPESNSLGKFNKNTAYKRSPKGRFPANLILDEESGALLDEQSGTLKSGGGNKANKIPKIRNSKIPSTINGGDWGTDSGGASRFFYCAKASKSERNAGCEDLENKTRNRVNSGGIENDPKWKPIEVKNHHPTVKPIKLMEYLIKLITPKNGIVLDPFSGSGSTLDAADNLKFDWIGIELNSEYVDIINARTKRTKQFGLF